MRQGHTQPVGGKKTLPALTDCSRNNAANKQYHYPYQFVGQHLSYVVHQRNHSVLIYFCVWFFIEKDMWNRQGAATALLHVLSKGLREFFSFKQNDATKNATAPQLWCHQQTKSLSHGHGIQKVNFCFGRISGFSLPILSLQFAVWDP